MLSAATLAQNILELPFNIAWRSELTEARKSKEPDDSIGNFSFWPPKLSSSQMIVHPDGDAHTHTATNPMLEDYEIETPWDVDFSSHPHNAGYNINCNSNNLLF